MGESIGIGDVTQALTVGAKITARAEQFQAEMAAKMAEIAAKEHSPALFPKPGDEFSQPFAENYGKDVHNLEQSLAQPTTGKSSGKPPTIGHSLADIGTYVSSAFVSMWDIDQQNSQNLGG
jgi:hypothetical protein